MARMDEGIGAAPRAGDTADVVARWAEWLHVALRSARFAGARPTGSTSAAAGGAGRTRRARRRCRRLRPARRPARAAHRTRRRARPQSTRPHELRWCRPTLAHGRWLDRGSHSHAQTTSIWSLRGSSRTVASGGTPSLGRSRRGEVASSSGAASWSVCRSRTLPAARAARVAPARAVSVRWVVVPSHAGRRRGRAATVLSKTQSSSISARCGRARCAVRCWPSAGFASSRSSRHVDLTVPVADRRRSSIG